MALVKINSTGTDLFFMEQVHNVLDLMRRGENLRFEVRILIIMVQFDAILLHQLKHGSKKNKCAFSFIVRLLLCSIGSHSSNLSCYGLKSGYVWT